MNRIPDPAAAKPEDWDENAPRIIPDDEAEKPGGWLDDEPAEVPDPGLPYIHAVPPGTVSIVNPAHAHFGTLRCCVTSAVACAQTCCSLQFHEA